MRKRHDAASKFVVFHDILVPLASGLREDRAFALILEQCAYAPVWSGDEQRVALLFRGKDCGTLAPERFECDARHGAALTRVQLTRHYPLRLLGADER